MNKSNLLIVLVILISYVQLISIHPSMLKLKQNTQFSEPKRTYMSIIGTVLLNNDYPLSFVAGMLANVYYESNVGEFESSNVNNKPERLKYLESKFKYNKDYSGKSISQVSLNELLKMIVNIKTNWKGYFGLGCFQWNKNDSAKLVNLYIKQGSRDKITMENAAIAEGKMIIEDMRNEFKGIYIEWDAWNNKYNEQVAGDAGDILCYRYVDSVKIPRYTNCREVKNTAVKIFNIIKN